MRHQLSKIVRRLDKIQSVLAAHDPEEVSRPTDPVVFQEQVQQRAQQTGEHFAVVMDRMLDRLDNHELEVLAEDLKQQIDPELALIIEEMTEELTGPDEGPERLLERAHEVLERRQLESGG
jgi:hypothetical protein